MTKVFDLINIDIEEGLDGSLDSLITRLTEHRKMAQAAGLTNIRVYTDCVPRLGPGEVWKLFIVGDEKVPYKFKLPPEQYERIFQMGVAAAKAGEPCSPYSSTQQNEPYNEAWYAGYNSVTG